MRRLALFSSVAVAVLLGLAMLRPVILGPVTGDDVYYSLRAAADPDRTALVELRQLPQEWSLRVSRGRVNVLTAAERRISGRAMVDTAVATGRPAHQVLAVFRIGYAALSLFAVYALLRALRWRRRDTGELERMTSRTRTIAMVAGGLAFAVGAQPQIVGNHGWNGWLSYPVSTWTAAFSIFGVVALALWLARLTAARGWAFGVPAVLVMALIGALTNYRYELTFPALPLTLIALALVPVTARSQQGAGRRAKWALGIAYVGGFLPLLIANRLMLRDVCSSDECYEGVTLALGQEMFRTFGVNVVSSIPGTGWDQVLGPFREEGIPSDGLWTPTLWSVLAALALVATLALAWRSAGPAATSADDPETTRSQTMLCLVAALLLLLGGLGAAAVMSLSAKAQSGMSEIGMLYRHSVVTWTGLAFALVLLVLALGLLRPRLATPAFLALALGMALLVATKMPADERTMAANASAMEPTMKVFDEVVRGDTSDAANERRCRILRDVDREMSKFYARSVRRTSADVFERYWDTPFCARP